ncbi:MAG: helicase associated domain-containing protein [Paracoccaceae bacterium]
MYSELIRYKEAHDDCNVPQGWPENKQLGTWVRTQRAARKRNQLTDQQQRLLEALGFDWSPDETSWERNFSDLDSYKKIHADCNVPHGWPENKQLGHWVANQRKARRTGQLSEERQRRLERIGFDWDPSAAEWEHRYSELVRYKEIYGDCNVPRSWPESEQLGKWVRLQRIKLNTLSKKKLDLLKAIGFDWDPLSTGWERMYSELIRYKEAHGDCNVPRSWSENEPLANWVSTQRVAGKRGRLTDERRRRLEAIGFKF